MFISGAPDALIVVSLLNSAISIKVALSNDFRAFVGIYAEANSQNHVLVRDLS
jgi:hypothetical protein